MIRKFIFSVIVSIGIVTINIPTFEYIPDYPHGEMGPEFYGFPFIRSTDTTWVNTGSGEIYLIGFIGNIIFWSFLCMTVIYFTEKIKRPIIKIIINSSGVVLVILSVMISILYYSAIEWRIKLDHDSMKNEYFIDDLEYERNFYWIK